MWRDSYEGSIGVGGGGVDSSITHEYTKLMLRQKIIMIYISCHFEGVINCSEIRGIFA